MRSEPDSAVIIVVMGASAGGVEALQRIVSALPRELEAAVFVVLHTLATEESLLPEILSRSGPLQAVAAQDGLTVERGKIYVAPPDRHIVFENGNVRVIQGPPENRHRPSIDVLFRSAAEGYGSRVVGVLLSGSDNDGTAGLLSIRQCGGVTIVQEPSDAAWPWMPKSALRAATPNYTLPAAEIGPLLRDLAKGRA